mmetsp:Transcript_95133/g.168447  ORF Transcript_95133/g.168447 Transcript_95133/m.168447 type:complete len:85 (+) Transcript_95133:120-374(+)
MTVPDCDEDWEGAGENETDACAAGGPLATGGPLGACNVCAGGLCADDDALSIPTCTSWREVIVWKLSQRSSVPPLEAAAAPTAL